ncbi:MAG: hypothetical protein AB8G11_14930 [Saprospiraceae bacterium]
MKAKLFKFLPIELKKSTQNPDEFQLTKPVEISAENYINLSKFKLPTFITKLLSKKIIIKNIIWSPRNSRDFGTQQDKQKSKHTTIETEINLQPLFKKAEKYIELNEAKLIVSTDINVVLVTK